ncbi:MAG TPA: GNAT family N-acetyltransferase, partial [Cytophagaceae bacterium]
ETLILRDFSPDDIELNEFFLNQGLLKTSLPDTHTLSINNWPVSQQFPTGLDRKKRQYINHKVFNYLDYFHVNIEVSGKEKSKEWYDLYRNVNDKSHEINTFSLPLRLFEQIADDPSWEVIELRLKTKYDITANHKIVAAMFARKDTTEYCPLFVGLDYEYLDLNIYPQILWQTILRARNLKLEKVNLGFTASQNKRKFGATAFPQIGFVQLKDNLNLALLALIPNKSLLFVEKLSR